MADNIQLNEGVGGKTLAADDINNVLFQRVKLVEGADNSNDGDISSANPLPVQLSDGTETVAVDTSNRLTVVSDVTLRTDQLMNNATAVTPVFAVIATGTSETIVAAQGASNKIRILALYAQANGATDNITFESNTTALSGVIDMTVNAPIILPFNPLGWMETAANETFEMDISGGTDEMNGFLVYAVVT